MAGKRIVIAGAGISGLALAKDLAMRGCDVQVFEASTRSGGKIRSVREQGFLCEEGPASFIDRDGTLHALARSLGIDTDLVGARDASRTRLVVADGALQVVPETITAVARTPILDLASKTRLLADLGIPRGPSGRGEEESIAAFARRRFGVTAAERFFYPIASGIYAGDPEMLSLRSTLPAVAQLEREHRSILWGAARASRRVAGAARVVLQTFRGGLGQLTDALANNLGERLHLGSPLHALGRSPRGWTVTFGTAAGESTAEADIVILAVPAYAAATVLAPLDPPTAKVLEAIPYAPLALTQMGYPTAQVSPVADAYGFFAPPAERRSVLGGVFNSASFPHSAPGGQSLFSLRLGGVREPALLQKSDAELTAAADGEMRALLGAKAAPSFVRTVRHDKALPQYTLGHRERVGAIEACERRLPGLYFHGNAYRGAGLPECVSNSHALADRIVTGT